MKKFLKIILFILLMSLTEVSSLFSNVHPGKFARERNERNRNRTTVNKSINPVTDVLQTLPFVGIVNRYGYPAEEHIVTTIDGYRLRIHRIPGSAVNPKPNGKPVIFLQHGLFSSSDQWIFIGPTHDFAYTLADAGYDLWFGNARGNIYSRSHVRLSPDNDTDFWQFSFHEMALFDIPTVIDYILQETGQKQLTYVGHSMGTTISYALLSTRPDYNQKIKLVISMAPSAFWHEPLQPVTRFLKENAGQIQNLLTNSRVYELFPLPANGQMTKTSCTEKSIFQQLCLNFVYSTLLAYDNRLNQTVIPYVLSYFPAGASSQTVLHYIQNIVSGDFKMYNYGTVQNFARYGQAEPPSYNLNNVVAPVAIFYGKGDALISLSNVFELTGKLPNVVALKAVGDNRSNHGDFLYSQDIKSLLNESIMVLL